VKHVAGMEQMKNTYSVLVDKPAGERPLENIWRRLEYNIRMYLSEIGWGRCGLDLSGSG